jgi:hypothetical protein
MSSVSGNPQQTSSACGPRGGGNTGLCVISPKVEDQACLRIRRASTGSLTPQPTSEEWPLGETQSQTRVGIEVDRSMAMGSAAPKPCGRNRDMTGAAVQWPKVIPSPSNRSLLARDFDADPERRRGKDGRCLGSLGATAATMPGRPSPAD